MTIQRYSFWSVTNVPVQRGCHDAGEYVLHADHLAAMEAGPRWIALTYQMPPEGTGVLVSLKCSCCSARWLHIGWHDRERGGWTYDTMEEWEEGDTRWTPTHWQPIQQPPEVNP